MGFVSDIENRMVLGREEEMESVGRCPLCREPVFPGEDVAVLPEWDRAVHWECLDEYLIRNGLARIKTVEKEDAKYFT
jgi:hypothetical protein